MLLVGTGLRAQQVPGAAVPVLSSVPNTGVVLDQGWKFRAGDDPAWAQPDFDDRDWAPINPNQRPQLLPQVQAAPIGWLRLRLQVPDSLRTRALVLLFQQTCASEVYLNGRLLHRYGVVNGAPDKVQPAGFTADPLEVHFTGPTEQVLAIRFAAWPPLAWFKDNINFMRVRITGLPGLLRRNVERTVVPVASFAAFSLFLLLSLLHLFFLRYNPAQRANLYFAIYAGTGALGFLGLYAGWSAQGMAATLALGMLADVFLLMSYMWAVRALYALFRFSTGRIYTGLWMALVVCLVLSEFTQLTSFSVMTSYSFAFFGFVALASAEQLRLTMRALRQRQRGAGLIAAGFVGALVCAFIYAMLIITNSQISFRVSSTLVTLMALFPALGISLFLAREFASNSELLLVKLQQVQELSQQALAQQQEKQALLAAQNELLEQQVAARTQEVAGQRDRAELALSELKTAQSQLVQAEKMAFLGELTAGIAHELQNPLAFMKSFAEVSSELVDGMSADPQEVGVGAGLEGEILAGLKQNLQQISQHGQRASSIIKGMLEHSRSGTGQRVPTDLNALADESLTLAYEGLEAEGKGVDATLNKAFDRNLKLVSVVTQDMGRVLVNLCTNALYAVRQRQQQALVAAGDEFQLPYQPTVAVSTSQIHGKSVEIRVRDNGIGMAADVKENVFKPFFTTKPAGEGTGLGLSLSHDIVTKGHGGTLTVESCEGEGSEFIITLPA
ncbi:ATP-binding protein [Hymenobacter arizonensis]|uniref:histidine kinase n=1 Tax=Hymenobacter arizonensis TaxID=1227077 RepID=A0A1I6B9N0_HYMAR|nr:ATP-binding protein [Hymenobacter arizonensis]SFQ77615.1 His Kinase A (phospho-acceptor) domain-containing protein [Hymenobacter arizonensis]